MKKRYIDDRVHFESALLFLEGTPKIENEETAVVFDRLTYVIFGVGIMPSDGQTLSIVEGLSSIYSQTKELSGNWYFAPEIKNAINELYYLVKSYLPLKVGVKKAAKLLRDQLVNDPFHNGIEIGSISQIMDLSKTTYIYEDLPYYSRIGLWYHSNRVINEEQQLLSDAFYLLSLAEAQYNKMFTYKDTLPKLKKVKHLNDLTNMNANVCSFCRNCIISFYAFFESFTNGIGLEYLFKARNESIFIETDDVFALQGKDRQGNHYLRLEMRLECLQRIIAGKILFKTNNPQQLTEECFIILFDKMKSRRDIAMHYSKAKGEIMYSPQEWMDEAILVSKNIVSAARKLWKACYATSDHYPYYLRELDYDYLLQEAEKRVVVEDYS